MKNAHVILILSGSLLFHFCLSAAPAKKTKHAPAMALNQLIKIAINNNPGLKSRKLAWQSKIQQYPQAIALNDPKLVYSEAINPVETRLGPQDRSLSLSQKFPYPGKRRLKGEVVKKDIQMAKIRYDKASRDLIVSLKQSFYELVYIENAIKLTLQNKKLLERITHIATSDYATSASTLNSVAKAQSQYAQVSYDVQLLQELRATEITRLNTLLNRKPDQALRINPYARIPTTFAHPLTRLYQWVESNEELKIADLAIDKSGIQTRLSRYTSKPDFDIGVKYTEIGRSDISGLPRSGRDGLAVSIGINIPLNREKNSAIKRQAHLDRLRNIEDKQTLANSLKNRVKGIYFKLTNAQRLITLYGKSLIPQANRAMQVAQLQYRENKGSIASYLETQSTWLNFKLAYQRAIADYWKNLAEMEKLTGKKL
jgi:outer membrane protein TolC